MTSLQERLRGALSEDHGRLAELMSRVSACVDAGDAHGAIDEWGPLERALLAHMDAEEMHVLPGFAQVDPEEARRLRSEHDVIRAELGDLAIALELHAARKPMFDELLARLAMHAAREDELMYAWAGRTVPERVAAAVRRWLSRPAR